MSMSTIYFIAAFILFHCTWNHTISCKNLESTALKYDTCDRRVHTVLPATKQEPLLLSSRASPFFWSVLIAPTHGMMAMLNRPGWLVRPHSELNPDTVTHPSSNRVWRRATSFIWQMSLPTTPHRYLTCLFSLCIKAGENKTDIFTGRPTLRILSTSANDR